jgi:hypothetical protein
MNERKEDPFVYIPEKQRKDKERHAMLFPSKTFSHVLFWRALSSMHAKETRQEKNTLLTPSKCKHAFFFLFWDDDKTPQCFIFAPTQC